MDSLIIDYREMEKKGDSKTDLDAAQKTSRAKQAHLEKIEESNEISLVQSKIVLSSVESANEI